MTEASASVYLFTWLYQLRPLDTTIQAQTIQLPRNTINCFVIVLLDLNLSLEFD